MGSNEENNALIRDGHVVDLLLSFVTNTLAHINISPCKNIALKKIEMDLLGDIRFTIHMRTRLRSQNRSVKFGVLHVNQVSPFLPLHSFPIIRPWRVYV